ncbi:MAG: ATP-dependent DNA helicase [Clostridia bacterium]
MTSKELLTKIFTEILPNSGLNLRTQQLELSLKMLEALGNNKIALCEAEVGTGKTHAYLLASVVHNLYAKNKKSAIISTSTIALQNAIISEYIPQISKVLQENNIIAKPLKFTIRKGKSNYICDAKLKRYINSSQKKEIKGVVKLNGINLEIANLPKEMEKRICVTNCELNCEFKNNCRYKKFINEASSNNYDFQIINHNYFIADILLKKQTVKSLLSDFGQVIVDEAHKLPSTINDMYGKSILENEVPKILKALASIRKVSIATYEETIALNKQVFEYAKIYNSDHFMLKKQLRFKLEKIIRYLNRAIKPVKKNNKYPKFIEQFDSLVAKFEELAIPNANIIWLEKEKQINKIAYLSQKVKKEITSDLWDINIPTILTSGTISVNGDFSHLEENLGLTEHENRILRTNTYSPFDYEKQAILYMPKKMPYPNYENSSYKTKIADEITKIIKATHGHTLILFTSYNFLDDVFYEIQSKNLLFPLFKMTKGKLNIIDEFKNSKNGVLFASDSAGEGIDIAGDVLSSLIVVKLPFPMPNAKLEYERQRKNNHNEFMQKDVVPQMIIKLRQWIGRGIRRESDTCTFAILDPRASGRYRETILNALPEMPVTTSRKDVSQFILGNKNIEYFE